MWSPGCESEERAATKTAIAYFEGRARVEPIRVMLEELEMRC